jgi:hypothetical protein
MAQIGHKVYHTRCTRYEVRYAIEPYELNLYHERGSIALFQRSLVHVSALGSELASNDLIIRMLVRAFHTGSQDFCCCAVWEVAFT